MTELIVCFGLLLGRCEQAFAKNFPTEAECMAEAKRWLKNPNVVSAVCQLPEVPEKKK
jgi:hypothetical protein